MSKSTDSSSHLGLFDPLGLSQTSFQMMQQTMEQTMGQVSTFFSGALPDYVNSKESTENTTQINFFNIKIYQLILF